MKGLVAWFAGNHVAANLLMLFLLLAGAVTGLTMKLEVFPEYSMDRISVTMEYPGASPSEVEEAVIRRIEENVAGLAGVKRIDSVAGEGFGVVTIEVMKGWDLRTLLDEVKAEVDRITTFPQEAEKAVIREVTRRHEVINMAVYGDVPESVLKQLAETVKDEVTNLPGVTLAELFGVRRGEIHVEVSESALRRYGLTLGRVADVIRRASLDLPAGTVKTTGGEILIRAKGRRYRAADYRDIAVITRTDGGKVLLGDFADLKDGFEDVDVAARFQGKPAVIVQVFRVADQSALEVADTVKKYARERDPTLPEGVRIGFFQDMSKILQSRIHLLLKNLALGLVLVGLLLSVFLNLRLAFWVTLGIPVSFLAGLTVLPGLDVSINMVSLFAFILVLGIVVDDAIVVGESIHRKREQGIQPLEAAISGTLEVGRPVVFAVLTTVAAFWPLLLGGGMMGKILMNIPLVVIMVILGSLVESLLILPCHLAGARGAGAGSRAGVPEKKWAPRMLNRLVAGPYTQTAAFCMKWRYATVALGAAILLCSFGLWTGGWIGFTLFPKVESDVLTCSLTMPTGIPVDRTMEVTAKVDRAAREVVEEADRRRPRGAPPLLEHTISLVGVHMGGGMHGSGMESGGHLAQVFVQLLESEKREVSASHLVQLWRERVGLIPDAETVTFQSDLFRAGNPVEVHMSLKEEDQLEAAVERLKKELRSYPGAFDVADSFLPGKPEMRITLKPSARSLGLTLEDLARQVRHAFYGAEALRFQRDWDEVKVLVRYPERERKSLGNLSDMRVRTQEGDEVPFSQAAEITLEQGYSSIQRAQRYRVIKVTADVDEVAANANEVRQDLMNRVLPDIQAAYPGLRYTLEGEGKEQKESLEDVGRGFLLALFCIYALLAVPFKSFTQPLIVMTAIPFGIVGALLGHLIMGLNLTLLSLIGVVGLAGVVVNDSLVLIHAANRIRAEGADPHEAVLRAGALRFRAILLTSLTTFAGLTPMLLERSMQAQFLIPMAVSLGFGVLFATGITLLLVPCGYLILEDVHAVGKRMTEIRSS